MNPTCECMHHNTITSCKGFKKMKQRYMTKMINKNMAKKLTTKMLKINMPHRQEAAMAKRKTLVKLIKPLCNRCSIKVNKRAEMFLFQPKTILLQWKGRGKSI